MSAIIKKQDLRFTTISGRTVLKEQVKITKKNNKPPLEGDDENSFYITFNTTADFIADWAASVADKCEVSEPQTVRDMVIDKIKNNKYNV